MEDKFPSHSPSSDTTSDSLYLSVDRGKSINVSIILFGVSFVLSSVIGFNDFFFILSINRLWQKNAVGVDTNIRHKIHIRILCLQTGFRHSNFTSKKENVSLLNWNNRDISNGIHVYYIVFKNETEKKRSQAVQPADVQSECISSCYCYYCCWMKNFLLLCIVQV